MIEHLVDWSHKNFAKLPWRQNRTLYTTLVSEIMLQQTTVGTVIQHFDRFVREYPSYENVASASEEQLTISWKGLGYYRRARNLKKACQKIAELGKVPNSVESLTAIPGIGDYTAGAILGIGMNLPFLAIDGNLERVIARLYGLTEPAGTKLKKQIMTKFQKGEICQEIYQVGGRAYNEALMDLGRNFCKAKVATCELCPLRQKCVAAKSQSVLKIPVKETTKSVSHKLTLLRLIIQNEGKFYAYQKKPHEWLSGQWEIPTFVLDSEDQNLKQYPWTAPQNEFDYLPSYKTLITKYRIDNKVLALNLEEAKVLGLKLPEGQWFSLEDRNLNLTTATIKALEL